MKQKIILLFISLSFCSWIRSQEIKSGEHFYYYKREKVFLNIDYSRISIVSEDEYFVERNIIAPTVTFITENSSKSHTWNHIIPGKDFQSLPADVYLLRQ
jgi:hypothetical protein